MKKFLLFISAGIVVAFIVRAYPQPGALAPTSSPVPTEKPTAKSLLVPPAPVVVEAATITPTSPVRVSIPAISLDTKIVSVGLNEKQLMEVPSMDVGWYKLGTKPGEKGNAVLAGHFEITHLAPGIFYNLSQLKIGDEIFVTDSSSHQFHYKVSEIELVPVSQFSVAKVYGSTDKTRLNLVTCAGTYDTIKSDFSHRTIVYSDLVN